MTHLKVMNMEGSDPKSGFLAALVYNITLILLFPVSAVGLTLMTLGFIAGRKSSVSGTAQAPLIARWYQHHLGTRRDEAAMRLMEAMPGIPLALPLGMGPMVLAHRVSGFVPADYRYPFAGEVTISNQGSARQTFYDEVLKQSLASIKQFVILGAGFDTRAINVPRDSGVRSFEVETPATQTFKRQMLQKADIDAGHVTFVPADFEKDDWLVRLVEEGFDLNKPTLFIWEGVTPYLGRSAVEETLRKIASTAKGSMVAFDYFSSEVLESPSLMMRSIRASLSAGGEPLKFGIVSTPPLRDRTVELVESCGLRLSDQRTMGQETEGKRSWGGFAVAAVK
jgi:methyltransferase (TIGR00027 family)